MHEEALRIEHEALLAIIGAKDVVEARHILDALRRSRHDALNDAVAYRMMVEHVGRQLRCADVGDIPNALADLIGRATEAHIVNLAGTQAAGLAEKHDPAEVLQ